MDAFFQLLSSNSVVTFTLIVFLGIFLVVYVVAFAQGREVSFWPPKIGAKLTDEMDRKKEGPRKNRISKKKDHVSRVSIMASTTDEIAKESAKTDALKRFYKQLLREVEGYHWGLNFCGAEPFREVIALDYAQKLREFSRDQMAEVDRRIRWYWYPGDRKGKGFNFEPAFYTSCRTNDGTERTLREVSDANIIIAFTGGTGTLGIVNSLIVWHSDMVQMKIDLNKKPLILLGWFGGSVKEFIDKNRDRIDWLLQKYPELKPAEEIPNWYDGDMPEKLAKQLMESVQRLYQLVKNV